MWWKPRHIALLVLAFCLLTGSVGVAATQRFCAMLGMSSEDTASSNLPQTGCCQKKKKSHCAEKEPQTAKKKSCCSVATTYHKLDISSSLKVFKIDLAAPQQLALLSTFFFPPIQETTTHSMWPLYSDTSPPLSGRDLLKHVQTFLI